MHYAANNDIDDIRYYLYRDYLNSEKEKAENEYLQEALDKFLDALTADTIKKFLKNLPKIIQQRKPEYLLRPLTFEEEEAEETDPQLKIVIGDQPPRLTEIVAKEAHEKFQKCYRQRLWLEKDGAPGGVQATSSPFKDDADALSKAGAASKYKTCRAPTFGGCRRTPTGLKKCSSRPSGRACESPAKSFWKTSNAARLSCTMASATKFSASPRSRRQPGET